MAYIPAVASERLVSIQGAKSPTSDLVLIAGRFTTANGAAVTDVVGEGFKVQRDNEGQWTILFTGCIGKKLISCVMSAHSITTTDVEDVFAQPGIYTESTGIMEVNGAAISAPTTESDIPLSIVSFVAVFHERNSLSIVASPA